MASLTGTKIKDTYDALLKVSDNGALDGTLQTITDGLGNNSSLSLSTAGASVTGTLAVSGAATLGSSATIGSSAYVAATGIATIKTNSTILGATSELGLLIANDGTINDLAQIGFGYSESRSAAVIAGIISNASGSTTSDLLFATRSGTSGSTAPTERMRIDSSGNVGINCTPSAKLDARLSGTSSGAVIQVGNAGSGGFGGLGVSDGGAYPIQMWGSSIAFLSGSSTYASATEKMRIDSSGNVGIGTTSTTATYGKLSIAGGMRILDDSNAKLEIGRYSAGAPNSYIKMGANSNSLRFTDHNDQFDLLTIVNDGNVGINCTPSAMSAVSGIELVQGSQISSRIAANVPQLYISSNIAGDSYSPTYKVNGYAAQYRLQGYDGTHTWLGAPSGTAGASVTFTERMRITSGGYLKASNDGSYLSAGSNNHELRTNKADDWSIVTSNSNATSPYGQIIQFDGASPNGADNYFLYCLDSTAVRLRISSNGNVQNTNNSYGAISDAKVKENIVDATPKLEKLMDVRVVNYNLIGDDKKQLGVVAQELEEVFPSMIEESKDFEERQVEVRDEEGNIVYKTEQVEVTPAELDEEGNVISEAVYETIVTDEPEMTTERVDLGTVTKSVKYSVFVPMLIKAIQEQQEIINDLKARIETLENK